MEQHVKVVAILNIVCGGLGLLLALVVLLFFGGMAGVVHSDPSPDSDLIYHAMSAPERLEIDRRHAGIA